MQVKETQPEDLAQGAGGGFVAFDDTPVAGARELTGKLEYDQYTTPASVSPIHQLEQLNDKLSDSNNQGRGLPDT